jgi:hypothetical protein
VREARAIAKLKENAPFPQLCEAFLDMSEEEAARGAMALLLRWVEDGLICDAVVE